LLEVDKLKYSYKKKFTWHMKRLEVPHVVLDLGAGSSFDALDFFLSAQRGVLVVTPQPTAIENAYHFLGAASVQVRVLEAVCRQLPVLQLYPGCAFATSLRSVIDGLRGEAFAAGRDALPEARRGQDRSRSQTNPNESDVTA
jgi:hypothetical protein